MNDNQEYMEIDLINLVKVIWARVWIVILAAIAAGGIAFSYTYFLVTPLYKANAMIYVNNTTSASLGSASFSISSSELSAAQTLVDTYIVILESRMALNEVIEKAGLNYTYEELKKMISASSVNGTEIFKVEVTSPDPFEAERIANTITQILPERIAGIVDGSSVKTVDYAVVPAMKDSPSITKNTAIGILLGVIVSAGAIALSVLFDKYIRTEDYLTQTYNLPVLSVIPDMNAQSQANGYYGAYYENASKQAKE